MAQSATMVVWNCAGSFSRKASIVRALKPDILVLAEAEHDAAASLGPDVTGCTWAGRGGQRGLAVIGFNGWRIAPADIAVEQRLFLPVEARNSAHTVQVVGVCAKKTTDFVTPTRRALAGLEPFVRSSPTIIAGDFNQSAAFDNRRSPSRQFRRVVEDLNAMGLRSAWHECRDEEFGTESQATLYWRWSAEPRSQFHIDYLFASREIGVRAAMLGSFDDYVGRKVSDHVPLQVSLSLP